MTTLPFSSHAHSSQIPKLLYTLCRRMLPCAYGSLLSEMKTQKPLGLEVEMKWIRQEGRPTSKYTSSCSPCGRLQPRRPIPMLSSQNCTQRWRIFQFSNQSYNAVFLCETSWFLKSGEQFFFFFLLNTRQAQQNTSAGQVWLPGCQFSRSVGWQVDFLLLLPPSLLLTC